MQTIDIEKEQAHWLLAKVGKKVLRPGGKQLTLQLIQSLHISKHDDILEFAPGMGATASLLLHHHPKSYTAVDADEEVTQNLQHKFIHKKNCQIILNNAANSQQPMESKDKVIGEAMLTMQADHRKSEIIAEAHRILKKGGLYGVHELCLEPENIDEATKAEIQKKLAIEMHVNARPLTVTEWTALFEKEGFKIKEIHHSPMHLLEFRRLIADEGIFGFLKIGFNVLRNNKIRKRILQIRDIFREYQSHISAISIVAEKL